MCFYSSNSKRALALAKRYGVKTNVIEMAKDVLEEQYKITAFTHPECPIVTENESIEIAKWGLIPNWIKSVEDAEAFRKMCLNAKAETVFEKPSFSVPILAKRCLIPATGYFEFHHEGNTAIPYYIFLKNKEIFSFGGIYEQWKNPFSGEITQTFTVIIVPANTLCARINNSGKNPFRMPLIIEREDENNWIDNSLNKNNIQHFFKSFDAEKMDAYPVSKDFLKKRSDDVSVIERAA